MVPAYTLPDNIENFIVMRTVVRQGFSRNMADMLLGDIKTAILDLEKLQYPTQTRIDHNNKIKIATKIFNHNGIRRDK